jgi:hypothetical protein
MNPDSAVKKVSEGQTWSSEDTRLLVSKSFLAPARSSICLPSLRNAPTAAAFSEAERIVFAAEGLFLAHDFPFYCGIRVETTKSLTGQARPRAQERFARELPVRLLKLRMGRFVRLLPH